MIRFTGGFGAHMLKITIEINKLGERQLDGRRVARTRFVSFHVRYRTHPHISHVTVPAFRRWRVA